MPLLWLCVSLEGGSGIRLECRFAGSESRANGFEVSSSGFRVKGAGFRVLALGPGFSD